MDENLIISYLKRAQEITGDRSQGELEYDDAVVSHLEEGRTIKQAIQIANTQFPHEALDPSHLDWHDVEERYQYLKEHKAILAKLKLQG